MNLARSAHWREDEVHAGEGLDKVRSAVARYTLTEPTSRAEFEEGFALLDATFGPTGEIETAEMLGRWFGSGSLSARSAPIRAHYHMVLARDTERNGEIAGVRDCFVTVDESQQAPEGGRAHVLLSHSLVLPAHRRTGVGALLRHVPIALARQHLVHRHSPDLRPQILLFAEMDQVVAADRITVIRLLAYGRAGFRVIPPTILPFAQPDFRDEVQHGDVPPCPLPFLCVVRDVGNNAAYLDSSRVRDVVDHALAVHRCHARGDHLDAIRDHALGAVAVHENAHGTGPIALIDLPTGPLEVGMLAPLLRAVTFPLYPPTWRGDEPLAQPDDELAALIREWSAAG